MASSEAKDIQWATTYVDTVLDAINIINQYIIQDSDVNTFIQSITTDAIRKQLTTIETAESHINGKPLKEAVTFILDHKISHAIIHITTLIEFLANFFEYIEHDTTENDIILDTKNVTVITHIVPHLLENKQNIITKLHENIHLTPTQPNYKEFDENRDLYELFIDNKKIDEVNFSPSNPMSAGSKITKHKKIRRSLRHKRRTKRRSLKHKRRTKRSSLRRKHRFNIAKY